MSVMAAFKNENSDRTPVWDRVVVQAKWRSEMGAYLVLSPQVKLADKVALNLHLHAIVGLVRGYKEAQGWCGACLDMGLMQLVSRLDGINQIATRYPTVVQQYNDVKRKAHPNEQVKEPRTKFIRTWEGHFEQPLLNEFVRICQRENRSL